MRSLNSPEYANIRQSLRRMPPVNPPLPSNDDKHHRGHRRPPIQPHSESAHQAQGLLRGKSIKHLSFRGRKSPIKNTEEKGRSESTGTSSDGGSKKHARVEFIRYSSSSDYSSFSHQYDEDHEDGDDYRGDTFNAELSRRRDEFTRPSSVRPSSSTFDYDYARQSERTFDYDFSRPGGQYCNNYPPSRHQPQMLPTLQQHLERKQDGSQYPAMYPVIPDNEDETSSISDDFDSEHVVEQEQEREPKTKPSSIQQLDVLQQPASSQPSEGCAKRKSSTDNIDPTLIADIIRGTQEGGGDMNVLREISLRTSSRQPLPDWVLDDVLGAPQDGIDPAVLKEIVTSTIRGDGSYPSSASESDDESHSEPTQTQELESVAASIEQDQKQSAAAVTDHNRNRDPLLDSVLRRVKSQQSHGEKKRGQFWLETDTRGPIPPPNGVLDLDIPMSSRAAPSSFESRLADLEAKDWLPEARYGQQQPKVHEPPRVTTVAEDKRGPVPDHYILDCAVSAASEGASSCRIERDGEVPPVPISHQEGGDSSKKEEDDIASASRASQEKESADRSIFATATKDTSGNKRVVVSSGVKEVSRASSDEESSCSRDFDAGKDADTVPRASINKGSVCSPIYADDEGAGSLSLREASCENYCNVGNSSCGATRDDIVSISKASANRSAGSCNAKDDGDNATVSRNKEGSVCGSSYDSEKGTVATVPLTSERSYCYSDRKAPPEASFFSRSWSAGDYPSDEEPHEIDDSPLPPSLRRLSSSSSPSSLEDDSKVINSSSSKSSDMEPLQQQEEEGEQEKQEEEEQEEDEDPSLSKNDAEQHHCSISLVTPLPLQRVTSSFSFFEDEDMSHPLSAHTKPSLGFLSHTPAHPCCDGNNDIEAIAMKMRQEVLESMWCQLKKEVNRMHLCEEDSPAQAPLQHIIGRRVEAHRFQPITI